MIEGAKAGRIGIVSMMLQHGIDANFLDYNTGCTALLFSCRRGDFSLTQLLIESGADVNICKRDTKNSPLVLAAKNGYIEILELLLSSSAMVNTEIWNRCLEAAASEGHLRMVRFLCSANRADLSAPCPLPGATNTLGYDVLVKACSRSQYDLVRFLVTERGVDPTGSYDPRLSPYVPMMAAMGMGDKKMVSLLLRLGAAELDPAETCVADGYKRGDLPKPSLAWWPIDLQDPTVPSNRDSFSL